MDAFLNMTPPLVCLFLITLFSTVSLHASTDESGSGDRFNFSSLVGRRSQADKVSSNDFPNGIAPVDVKDEGNENDPDTGLGMVTQEYSIGQTEVTAQQYCKYLNVVATGDNYLLFYNEKMGTDPNVASIVRNVINGKNKYSIITDEHGDRGKFPIVYVNLYQSARFCNWLQNKDTPGLTGDALTERGAYTLDGKSSGSIVRNVGAVWFIPTESEWYKPAYYKGGGLREGYWHFANRSDWAPSNSLKAKVNAANYYCSSYTKKGPPYLTPANYFKKSVGTYNTYDMGGNVAEWVATEEENGKYVARGGSWKSSYYGTTMLGKCDVADWGFDLSKWARPAYDPTQGYDNIGFRVATSILVDSTPPSRVAPGMVELSPTETIAAPFVILAGIGTIFAGKKIDDCRRDVATSRLQAEEQTRMRESTEGDAEGDDQAIQNAPNGQGWNQHTRGGISLSVMHNFLPSSPLTQRQIENFKQQRQEMKDQGLLPETPASIASSRQAGESILQSQKKLSIGQWEQEEIREVMRKINPLFEAAVEKQETFKLFLKEHGETDPAGLAQVEAICDAYDAYVGAVLEAANKIKEQFASEREVWIPWRRVAINVAVEAVLLRSYMIRPYEQPDVSIKESEVTRLRNDAKQKALDTILKNYPNLLDGNAPGAIDELEKYNEELQRALEKHKKYSGIPPMTNLVNASQLEEQIKQILKQRVVVSPGSAAGFRSIYDKDGLEDVNPMSNPLVRKNLAQKFKEVKTVPGNAATELCIIEKTNEQHAEDVFSNEKKDDDTKSQQSENSDNEAASPYTCTIM